MTDGFPFDFSLPQEAIAQAPASPRDTARLAWSRPNLGGGHRLTHHRVRDLPDLLDAGDLLVVNDTRVLPARLKGRRGDMAVEVMLDQRRGPATWRALGRPMKRLRVGDRLAFTGGLAAVVEDKPDPETLMVHFDVADGELEAALAVAGEVPLPPYIQRGEDGPTEADRAAYQTLFAAEPGAVAAPTAGLHFTPDLMARLAAAGIGVATVTLHVGAGTFLPIRTERPEDHRMHAEWGRIDAATADRINRTKAGGGRVVAVGTTSLRLIESAARATGRVEPFSGDTDLYIRPGFGFRAADMLLTNFHLPRSTLILLVAAFIGAKRAKALYDTAIAAGYRFYSYGDASLLEPEP